MSPSMDTPSGQILATKNIKDFTPMSEISPSQNILAITDNITGAGGKITTSNLCKSLLSSDAGNSVIQGEDGLLYGNAGLVKYRDDIVFQANDWALGEVSGEVGIYISLQDGNVGFPLTNTDYWKRATIGGGGGGLKPWDIGIALYVDESKGLRRYANGQVVSFANIPTDSLNKLRAIQAVNPILFTTETNWQAELVLSAKGQVGKYVLDEEAQTVRLPKIVNIQGVYDMASLGARVEAGLPNITGGISSDSNYQGLRGGGTSYGAFIQTPGHAGLYGESASNTKGFDFDASRSNPIYGNSDTVQEEAVQFPFFIQIATGQETQADIINTLQLANPYTLFDYKYTEAPLYNACWTLANGNWVSGTVKVANYEGLLVEKNTAITQGTTVELPSGTSYTKRGLSVKAAGDSSITDYDFVLDTANTRFKLPTKVKLGGGKAVVGNGMALGLADGTGNFSLTNTINGIGSRSSGYGANVGTSNLTQGNITNGLAIGVTTDPTKSGIETDTTNLYLYFYTGEVEQNVNLVNIGRIEETMATKAFATSASFPSDRYINLTLNASGADYIAPADGWIVLGKVSSATNQQITLENRDNGMTFRVFSSASEQPLYLSLQLKEGDKYRITYTTNGATNRFRFIYAEGN